LNIYKVQTEIGLHIKVALCSTIHPASTPPLYCRVLLLPLLYRWCPQATLRAMAGSIQKLSLITPEPLDYILVDGSVLPRLPAGCQAEAVVKVSTVTIILYCIALYCTVQRLHRTLYKRCQSDVLTFAVGEDKTVVAAIPLCIGCPLYCPTPLCFLCA